MSKYEYVGRAGKFLGKSLPQICLKLKDLGVGRLFTRDTYKRYPEVTYYILTHAEADMSDPFLRRGTFKADVVFRGANYGNVELPGYKEDFQLIAKEDEKHYLERTLTKGQKWRAETIVPKFIELPPLLKELLKQEADDKRVKYNVDEIKLPFIINKDGVFSHGKYE